MGLRIREGISNRKGQKNIVKKWEKSLLINLLLWNTFCFTEELQS